MDNKSLLEQMGRLGYPLMATGVDVDSRKVLAQVVRSDNGRYREGFPVLLANAAQQPGWDVAKADAFLKGAPEKKQFRALLLVSLAVYEHNKLKDAWVKALAAHLTPLERRKVAGYKKELLAGKEFLVGADRFDPQRLLEAFRSYFTLQVTEVRELGSRHDDLSLEFAFSQVFSPKQKELFNKKLKGEVLTKTEREYFSRVVRKRVSALANDRLHQLARRVLEL